MLQELLAKPPGDEPVIIDEIQKIPQLLDDVQWLIVNNRYNLSYADRVLANSNVAARISSVVGRLRFELFPLVYPEIPNSICCEP